MNKKIEDYLPCYIGCEVQLICMDYSSCTTILTAKIIDTWKRSEDIIKPLLRPLASMTEEERHKLSLFDTYIGGSSYSDVLKQDAEKILWLLSRRFDLLGLIDADLALDKTKQP